MKPPTENQAWALGRVREFSDRQIPVCQTGAWSGVSLPMMRTLAKHGWVEEHTHVMSGWPPIEIKGWRLTDSGREVLEAGR